MTHREENFLLDSVEDIRKTLSSTQYSQLIKETHENNLMLKYIVRVLNYYLANASTENENDFGRNILANLVSNTLDLTKFNRKIVV